MTEPFRADEHRHQQRVAYTLVQSQGWRDVFLPLIAQRCAEQDRLAANGTLDASIRLGAVERRNELLTVLATIYKRADEPNPFDAARTALWATLVPPREPPAPLLSSDDKTPAPPVRRQTTSGSIA